MKLLFKSLLPALFCGALPAHSATIIDDSAKTMTFTDKKEIVLSPNITELSNERRYGRNNLPFKLTKLQMERRDTRLFSFCTSSNICRGACSTLSAKTELPFWGKIGNDNVFSITAKDENGRSFNIGFIIKIGDTNGNMQSDETNVGINVYKNVFNKGWCSADSQGAKIRVIPVLIEVTTTNKDTLPEIPSKLTIPKTKLASIKLEKPTRVPNAGGSSQRFFNNINQYLGETEADVWLNGFDLKTRTLSCVFTLERQTELVLNPEYRRKYQAMINQTVKLPTISAQSLQQQNEVYGARVRLLFENECSKSLDDNGKELVVYSNFTDQTTTSNTTDVLTLSSSSTAKGVGIKLYPANESQAIRYGSPNDATTQREFFRPRSQQAPVNDYRIYYAKTGNTVTPGTVQAIVEYQFNYK